MNSKLLTFYLTIFVALSLIIGILSVNSPVLANPSLPIFEKESELSIEVYPIDHRLIVRKHGKKVKEYIVAVGNPSTPTPVGEYKVTYKGKDWGASFGPRWLGLNVPWGYYGIHGTNRPHSIGQHLSHGCIRMRNHDVLELFDMIPIGTKVTIFGHILGDPEHNPRDLAEGDIGGDVQLIQTRLKSAGYFNGICNGKFRSDTTSAVRKFQRDHGLAENGVVSIKVYMEFGLFE